MIAEDAGHRIVLADSQHRAPVLVQVLREHPLPEDKAVLLARWFNNCDAIGDSREPLREQMEIAGFFHDGESNPPVLPARVWRGAWDDDDVENALSWTTSRERAEFFARALVGMRARLVLGMYRDDADPAIFTAICDRAYGYLDDRGEQEVVAASLRDVELLGVFERVPASARSE